MNYGLQLYTLRKLTAVDMADVLNKVAQMGYVGVELAGFGNLDAQGFALAARENNLKVISAHIGMQDIENNFEGTLEWTNIVGLKRLTIPWIDGTLLDEEHIEETAQKINNMIEKLREHNIVLSYHNHDFEFINDRFDRLMKHCPDLQIELDTYWVAFAGRDPVKMMKKYARRLSLIHIKDMLDKEELKHEDPNPVILTGKMDIKAIIKQGRSLCLPWAIVEMDETVGDPLEDVEASLRNLKNLKNL